MKKIALLMIGVMLSFFVNAQTASVTAESLLKAKTKSDSDIQNPKKAAKYTTWVKRGDLYLDLVQFNTKGLWVGMPQQGLNGAELLVGKPQKIMAQGNKEDWIYERVTLHFEDGKLVSWDETKPLVENGEDVAMEAYMKAWEMDEKGKLKSDTKFLGNLATLRGLFAAKGVKYYNEAEKTKEPELYKKSVLELDKALKLGEFPKNEADSLFDPGLVTYYAGVIAQSGKHYDLAEKYYKLCIEKNYQGDKPYHALAGLYATQKLSDKELAILKEGFDKYPESNTLLVDFINYYLKTGESEEALKKLQKGLDDNPENSSYYFAIGTLYDEMMQDTSDKYTDEQKEEYYNLAIENYKNAIKYKEDYFDANFNLGVIYYNKANRIWVDAYNLPLNESAKFEKEKTRALDVYKQAQVYMEKAHELNYRDKEVVKALKIIYKRLGMNDKAKEMNDLLETLPEKTSPLNN